MDRELLDLDCHMLCVGPGWHQIVTSLAEWLWDRGWRGPIWQLKEKFGTLRFYWDPPDNWSSEQVKEAIFATELAYLASSVTCEDCGAPCKLRRFKGGNWLRTVCDEHNA